MKTLYSSASVEWETPQPLFDALYAEFPFTLDVCANGNNAKCLRFLTDALDVDWHEMARGGACWMNPPYGRGIDRWMRKALETSQAGTTVVCLVPARTDTRWWHEYVEGVATVRFIRGRVQFGNSGKDAPFPSAIVIYSDEEKPE